MSNLLFSATAQLFIVSLISPVTHNGVSVTTVYLGMPGKPKRPGDHGYGRRSKRCIERRFKSSKKRAVAANESTPAHEEVCNSVCCCAILS